MIKKSLSSIMAAVVIGNIAAPALGAGATFDQGHAAFTKVLAANVKSKKIDYAALKKDPRDLDTYLGSLAGVPKSDFNGWRKKQQLAFLINLYNANTLKLVVDHYPVKRIKDIGGFRSGPWKQKVVGAFGVVYTLDQIEHEMIRPNYDEPRAHFALNCASVGCPSLRNEAYTADKLDAQLHNQGLIFFGDASKNRVDVSKGKLYISPLFKWFKEDFVKKSGSVEAFIAPYVPEKNREAVRSGRLKVSYTDYNWNLNRQ